MSYAGIRFNLDESLLKDNELVELFRNRDNDEYYQRHKGLTVTPHSTTVSQDGKADLSGMMILNRLLIKPSDKVWLSMTDEERIENGLMSGAFYKWFISPPALLGYIFFNGKRYQFNLVWAANNYAKVYRPSGIILRRQRVETWSKYLL
jgi:hypothetical protein